jgi:hypothetical protein
LLAFAPVPSCRSCSYSPSPSPSPSCCSVFLQLGVALTPTLSPYFSPLPPPLPPRAPQTFVLSLVSPTPLAPSTRVELERLPRRGAGRSFPPDNASPTPPSGTGAPQLAPPPSSLAHTHTLSLCPRALAHTTIPSKTIEHRRHRRPVPGTRFGFSCFFRLLLKRRAQSRRCACCVAYFLSSRAPCPFPLALSSPIFQLCAIGHLPANTRYRSVLGTRRHRSTSTSTVTTTTRQITALVCSGRLGLIRI